MKLEERAENIISGLKSLYPDATCTLDEREPWKLLFSTRLAAQCTDLRVNMITPGLFAKYPTLESMADADIFEMEEIVRPCGLYKTKARDLKEGAALIASKFNGVVPDTLEELLTIPGIGRKTANLVLSDAFNKDAIVTDTHCIRLAGRFGLTKSKDPYKVEIELTSLIPYGERSAFCHRCVWHGRAVCAARAPKCVECGILEFCEYGGNVK